MRILEKTVRIAAVALAVLVIGLSLGGAFGAWLVNRQATDVALNGFGVVAIGVGTIATVGAKAQANSPVLKALNERLDTNLAPRVAQMQHLRAPVRDALGAVGNALSLLNALPILADRAPGLLAIAGTLKAAWIVYTQVVVIQHHRARMRPPVS